MPKHNYCVTSAIIQHYALKGVWPEWRDNPYPRDGSAPIRQGKTVADRIKTYTALCRKAGKELTVKRSVVTADYANSVVFENCTSKARFIEEA